MAAVHVSIRLNFSSWLDSPRLHFFWLGWRTHDNHERLNLGSFFGSFGSVSGCALTFLEVVFRGFLCELEVPVYPCGSDGGSELDEPQAARGG